MKNKHIEKYIELIIKNSWTFQRLTEIEQNLCLLFLSKISSEAKSSKGVCEAVNEFYKPFLDTLGYKPIGWREKTDLNF